MKFYKKLCSELAKIISGNAIEPAHAYAILHLVNLRLEGVMFRETKSSIVFSALSKTPAAKDASFIYLCRTETDYTFNRLLGLEAYNCGFSWVNSEDLYDMCERLRPTEGERDAYLIREKTKDALDYLLISSEPYQPF